MAYKNKKSVYSWAMYDWANSSYATTVMAGFFPVFFKQYWSQGTDPVVSTARLGTAISIGSLILAVSGPLMGVIADHRATKKMFTFLFMLISCLSCLWMSFIPGGDWESAIWAYGISMVCFTASCVFYDSLLPSVAEGVEMDMASSLGYALGYLGGGILFLLNVLMYLNPSFFGIIDGVQAVKISFGSVAVWWLLFSLPLFILVPEPKGHKISNSDSIFILLRRTVKELSYTFREVYKDKNIFVFMCAFWLYIDGVYTVISMAVDYGVSLGLSSKHLIAALLITQFVGFPTTYLYGRIVKKWGLRKPILSCIVIYSFVVVFATQISTEIHFYLLAMVIGSVQGGVQALSRSMFGQMIPVEKSGEYFGLMNVVGKFASILGPMIVAISVTVTQNSRMGMLGLLILFILGGILLWKVKEPAREGT